jgi:ABC-2 type transport system permease protein
MLAIIRKELADTFNSVRFLILFLLVLVASGISLYAVQQGIREVLAQSQSVTNGGFIFLLMYTASAKSIPDLSFLLSVLIPIIGIALGFDAINSERTGRTMSRLLAQPVYRDGIIIGKFLAGLFIIIIMVGTAILLVAGFGIRIIGVPPTDQEIIRLFFYFVVTVVYGGFWLGLSILCSVIFRRAAGSVLTPIVVFLLVFFLWVFMQLGVVVANAIVPVNDSSTMEMIIKNAEVQQTMLRLSPSYLFQEAYYVLLNPVMFGMGIVTSAQADYMIANPLSLGQSLLAIWPHLVGLISLCVVFFAVSYLVFVRQEIRST